ncbi:MAG: DNA repair protein RecN [Flavobacteriia bacterium]|nr:DNA repair protein RecN [Flavobacteriia bacterium]
MITHLHIRNYALISELDLDFTSGFSSITGETGAGKSILLGAMGLALGERADLKSALNADEKCIVELTVNLANYQLKSLFESLDLDYSDETILRREILPSGKSRAFVNDTPARVSDLNEVAQRLIDIHSQNDTLLLRDTQFQLSLIDQLAENEAQREAYKLAYADWKAANKALEAIERELTGGQDMDYQRFLLDELVDARLESPEEEDTIEEELHRLQHAEEVAETMGDSDRLMSADNGIMDQLESLVNSMASASKYDARVQDLLERVRSVQIELSDIQGELERIASNADFDPERLKVLDDRMSMLQHLKSKHRVSLLSDLIETRDEINAKVDLFANMEERIDEARSECIRTETALKKAGATLTESRSSVLSSIETRIGDLLTELNMPNARIMMTLEAKEQPGSTGYDEVSWTFSANMGRDAKPLHKVASGGELSRVMLALKAIMGSSKRLPTIIFDEIDTGISGETAKRVAAILKRMGSEMQVLAITHLPQIAAAGSAHYLVEKSEIEGVTRTQIRVLKPEERIEEVSRILSGDAASDAARANAAELLSLN